MPKYTFCTIGTISLHTEVTANTLEEAIDRALNRPMQSICHSCSKGDPHEWNTSGELDCDPASGPLVELYVEGEEVVEDQFDAAVEAWKRKQ